MWELLDRNQPSITVLQYSPSVALTNDSDHPNRADPNLTEHVFWDMPEKPQSMEVQLMTHRTQRIRHQGLVGRQNRKVPEVLCSCLSGSEPSPQRGTHGWDLFRLVPQMLDRTGIWGIWRPARCPEFSFCGDAGHIVLLGLATAVGESCCLKGVYLVCNSVWVVGACQEATVLMPEPKVS